MSLKSGLMLLVSFLSFALTMWCLFPGVPMYRIILAAVLLILGIISLAEAANEGSV